MNDRDVYLWAVPMFHCNGWGMVYAITGMGGRHVMLRKVDGPEILRRIDREGVTFMGGAPAVVNTILAAAAERSGPDARARTHPHRRRRSAAPDRRHRTRRDRARLGVHADLRSHRDVAAADAQPSPRRVGRPHARPNGRGTSAGPARRRSASRVRIDDDGEVLARGNVVFGGYWDQPDETAEVVADGWFRTGDGGRLDDHGYLTISDRKKDVIITGGENVSSIEVEDCLCQHPAVAEAAVIGVPDAEVGRDRQGARRPAPRRPRHRSRAASTTAVPASPTTSARPRSSSTTPWPAPRPARCRSSSSARPTGAAETVW